MNDGFRVGDLSDLTSRLTTAADDLHHIAERIAHLAGGRHGILHQPSAISVARLWAEWSRATAAHASTCKHLSDAISAAARDYHRTDTMLAGHPTPPVAGARTPAAGYHDQHTGVGADDADVGSATTEPAVQLADMVAAGRVVAVDLDAVAQSIAQPHRLVDWSGITADAAFAAIRDLSRHVAASATAVDGLTGVFAAYGDAIWAPPHRTTAVLDPQALAEQARSADQHLRTGITTWLPPHLDTRTTNHPVKQDEADSAARQVDTTLPTTVDTEPTADPTTRALLTKLGNAGHAHTYRVAAGDTLWAIARRQLGDARRWRDIFHLNEGRHQPGGRQLTDPRLILPGWRLRLPAIQPSRGPAPAPVNTPRKSPARPAPGPANSPSSSGIPATPARQPDAYPNHDGYAWMSPVDTAIVAATVGAGIGWAAGRRRNATKPTRPPRQPRPASDAADRDGQLRRGTAAPAASRALPETAPAQPAAEDATQPRPTITPPPTPAITTPHAAPPSAPPDAGNTKLPSAVRRWPDDLDRVGRGLVGPGAHAAARSILIDTVADRSAPHDAAGSVAAIVTAATADSLFHRYTLHTDARAGIAVVASITDALNLLDHEILHRSRINADRDLPPHVSTGDRPVEAPAWPPLLFVSDTPDGTDRARLTAILQQGNKLGVDALILGGWPPGRTLYVDRDGHATTRNTSTHPVDAGTLGLADTLDAVHALQAVVALAPAGPAVTGDTTHVAAAAAGISPIAPSADAVAASTATVAHTYADTGGHQPPGRTGATTVRVRVLGVTPDLVDRPPDGPTNPPFRPHARELLVYLMCHPGGVAEDILFDDVLGDVPASKVRSRLNTYLYNLHQKLRAAGGPGTYLTHSARGHILLDTDRIDCDLWRMQHHLRGAAATSDPDVRIRALRAAVAEYRGPLAADQDYFWIPPIREATRRAAIDAHTTLADLLTDRDPAAAAAILAHTIDHDPHNETLYQHAMRLHARVGDRDAISRLRARLIRELADIGVTPTGDTTQLVRGLLGPNSTGEA